MPTYRHDESPARAESQRWQIAWPRLPQQHFQRGGSTFAQAMPRRFCSRYAALIMRCVQTLAATAVADGSVRFILIGR